MAEFSGFPASTIEFLTALRANNDREWFAANRAMYDEGYVAPARAFVVAAGAALAAIVPGIGAEPRIDGSILRIARDMRFLRDSPPYKTHLDIWFWEGERASAGSGLYLRLTPETLALGVGARPLSGPGLARFRAGLTDRAGHGDLLETIEALGDSGWDLNPERYRRAPGGICAEPVARLLRRDTLRLTRSAPHPPELASAELVAHCLAAWTEALPVHRWLIGALAEPAAAREMLAS